MEERCGAEVGDRRDCARRRGRSGSMGKYKMLGVSGVILIWEQLFAVLLGEMRDVALHEMLHNFIRISLLCERNDCEF